jgi:hypothetical protein
MAPQPRGHPSWSSPMTAAPRDPDLPQAEFDQAVEAVRRLAARGNDPTPEEIARVLGDSDGNDLIKILQSFDFRSGEPIPGADPIEADEARSGNSLRPAAKGRRPPPEARSDAEDRPSLKPMGWIVLAGEAGIALVLAALFAPWLLEGPLSQPYSRLLQFLKQTTAEAAVRLTPPREPAPGPPVERAHAFAEKRHVVAVTLTSRDTISLPPVPPVSDIDAPALPDLESAVPIEETRNDDRPIAPVAENEPLAHRADRETRFSLTRPFGSASNDASLKDMSIGSMPKVEATFGSDALSIPVRALDEKPFGVSLPPPEAAPAASSVAEAPLKETREISSGPSETSLPAPVEAAAPIPPPDLPAVPPPQPAAVQSTGPPPEATASVGQPSSGNAVSPSPLESAPALSEPSTMPPDPVLSDRLTNYAAELAEAIAAERQQALERERERADQLARELARMREEIGALRARAAPRWGELNALPLPSPAAPEAPPSPSEPPAVVEAAPAPPAVQVRAEPPSTASTQVSPPASVRPPTAPAETVAPPAQQPAETLSPSHQRLIDRATTLIKAHDISGARLVLERAMSEGSARATYLLAQTYDPQMLRSWAVIGLRGDPAKANELYALARAGGVRDSQGRLVGR